MRRILLVVLVLLANSQSLTAAERESCDVLVYGGTAGGVAAAVQARRSGKTAILIEPSKHLGGLTSGGLGATDIGNKAAIGGIAREFYQQVKRHYADPAAWKFQKHEEYRSGSGRENDRDDAMWTFEPHVAEKILNVWVREAGVRVVLSERLVLKTGVVKEGVRITEIKCESGHVYAAKFFIDATYEGDLMAAAGVAYYVGREANATYDETLNGVQTKNAKHHQMADGVDPYVKPGDKSSGLLPGVHGDPPGEEGSGDRRVQAYNFRMCTTTAAENRIPFAKPAGYDPLRYELLLRNFEAGENRVPWNPVLMPNLKTDTNNNYGFSTDNIGLNYDYPDAAYATRERIFNEHRLYQQGLLYTLANNPRVPEKIRNEVSRWGLCKDESTETGGWPHQLYVREARRMISAYVMTQQDCQGRRVCDDSVGLGAYNMDSHNTQRYVTAAGHVKNEGDVQVGVSPYPISYRSLVPQASECTNLFVPVCLSASHIAYGSIRMEPVFMVLGQSSATAACLAIDENKTAQEVNYAKLREKLLEQKQVLAWVQGGGGGARSIDPKSLEGVVVDDAAAEKTGEWTSGASIGPYVGEGYMHDNNAGKGNKSASFPVRVKQSGKYEVRVFYSTHENRATNVPVTIKHAGGTSTTQLNERKKPPLDGRCAALGVFEFTADKEASVLISNTGTDGHVIVDAVQLVPKK